MRCRRLLKLDFNGKQAIELLGERDLTLNEVTAVISKSLNKPDLRYVQFPYEQIEQILLQMGTPAKTAGLFIEMFQGLNDGTVSGREARTAVEFDTHFHRNIYQRRLHPCLPGKSRFRLNAFRDSLRHNTYWRDPQPTYHRRISTSHPPRRKFSAAWRFPLKTRHRQRWRAAPARRKDCSRGHS